MFFHCIATCQLTASEGEMPSLNSQSLSYKSNVNKQIRELFFSVNTLLTFIGMSWFYKEIFSFLLWALLRSGPLLVSVIQALWVTLIKFNLVQNSKNTLLFPILERWWNTQILNNRFINTLNKLMDGVDITIQYSTRQKL